MPLYRFTCKPKNDADLAGKPASIFAVDTDTDEYVLEFEDGSKLRAPILDLVRFEVKE